MLLKLEVYVDSSELYKSIEKQKDNIFTVHFGKVSLMARQNYQAGVRTTAGSLSSVIAPCK